MSYELKRLLPRHFTIMDLVLSGQSRKAIADEVGMTPRAISNVTGSAIFQDELARRRNRLERQKDEAVVLEIVKAKQRLEQAAADAEKAQVELLDSPNPQVRLASATYILDRLGIAMQNGPTVAPPLADQSDPAPNFEKNLNFDLVVITQSIILRSPAAWLTLSIQDSQNGFNIRGNRPHVGAIVILHTAVNAAIC